MGQLRSTNKKSDRGTGIRKSKTKVKRFALPFVLIVYFSILPSVSFAALQCLGNKAFVVSARHGAVGTSAALAASCEAAGAFAWIVTFILTIIFAGICAISPDYSLECKNY